MQFGNVVFNRFAFPYLGAYQSLVDSGGYQNLGASQIVDSGGYQILLNYRSVCVERDDKSRFCSLNNIAKTFTLKQVLDEQILKEADVKNRIVLIGRTELSFGDNWSTPYNYNKDTQGLFLQAQMVSQILSAVLDKRPTLQAMSFWYEPLWIGVWSLVGGLLAWHFHSRRRLALAVSITALGICIISWVLLINGSWVPLIPPVLVLVLSSGCVVYITLRLRGQ